MTVEANTVQYAYTGNGATKVFAFPSKFMANSDIVVGVNGVQAVSGYTVAGAGNDAGGTVTFSVAPVTGAAIVLVRNPPQSQLTNWVNAVTVLAPTLTNALDKLTMVVQWLSRQLKRTLRLGDFDNSALSPLPAAAARAGNLLGFGPTGDVVLPVAYDDVQNAIAAVDDITAALTAGQSLAMRLFPGTGPVSRTYYSAAQDWVNVKEFGITGSGDEGAKLQTALNWLNPNSRVRLVFENGIRTSQTININNAEVTLEGVGSRRKDIVIGLTAGIPVISVNSARVTLNGLTVYLDVAATSGSQGVYWAGDDGVMNDVSVLNAYDGVSVVNAHNLRTNKLAVLSYVNAGILLSGTVGGWHSDFNINAGSTTLGANGGIRFINQVESVNFVNGEVLSGVLSLTSQADNEFLGTRPAYNRFTGVFFDGAAQGSYIESATCTNFTSCWFSGGREGDTNGCFVIGAYGLEFDGCDFVNCGRAGLRVYGALAKGVTVRGGRAFDNAKTYAAASGIEFQDVNGFIIDGVQTGRGIVPAYGPWPDSPQAYGVAVQTGNTNFSVKNVRNNGNATGAVYQGVTPSGTAVYTDNF